MKMVNGIGTDVGDAESECTTSGVTDIRRVMTTKAYIQPDDARGGIIVTVVQSFSNHRAVLTSIDNGVWTEVDEAVVAPTTVRLPSNVASALLEALLKHYGGNQDNRQLRADYDAERARVDKLINYAIGK
jgi:hypothetical protein